MSFDVLNKMYNEITNIINLSEISHDSASEEVIDKKFIEFVNYIRMNGEELKNNLIKNKNYSILKKISRLELKNTHLIEFGNQVTNIHNSCVLLELKGILEEKNHQKIADWMIQNKDGFTLPLNVNPIEFFDDMDKARELLLKEENRLTPEVGGALSHIVIFGLNLKDVKNSADVEASLSLSVVDGEKKLKAKAHWINAQKIPLKDAGLSNQEFYSIASYLQYVNYKDLNLDDPQKFIESCSNAYYLDVTSNNLRELNLLPLQLQELNLNKCSITKIDLSKNSALQKVYIWYCEITNLDVSNNSALEVLDVNGCPIITIDISKNVGLRAFGLRKSKITKIDLSNNTALRLLDLSKSMIVAIDLSKNVLLEVFKSTDCPITVINLPKNDVLEGINLSGCPITNIDLSKNSRLEAVNLKNSLLTTIDFSANLALKIVVVSGSLRLTSLGDFLPNTLELLAYADCINLVQLPQVPATTVVYSSNSNFGNLNSFKVNPSDIEQNPVKLLLSLGSIFLEDKPFPNIVYLDPLTGEISKGVDAGGLRGQFIYDLCQRLFRDEKEFSFIKNPGIIEGNVLTLVDSKDENRILALKTLARLIAFSIASNALITGSILSKSFYNTLLLLVKDPDLNTLKIPLEETEKKKIYLMTKYGFKADEEVPDDEKEFFVIADPLVIMAQELKAVLKERLKCVTLDDFIAKVEGIEMSAKMLLGHISKERLRINFNVDKAPQIEDFLKTFIKKYDKTKTLEDFTRFVTGSLRLGLEDQIKVYISKDPSTKHLPVTQTCFNWIKFPPYTDYDTFEGKLLQSLEAKDSFYID